MTMPRNSAPTRHRGGRCDSSLDAPRHRLASPKVKTTAAMTIAILTSALGMDGMSGFRALKPDVLNSIRLSRHYDPLAALGVVMTTKVCFNLKTSCS
jgi:hypothetical protein